MKGGEGGGFGGRGGGVDCLKRARRNNVNSKTNGTLNFTGSPILHARAAEHSSQLANQHN